MGNGRKTTGHTAEAVPVSHDRYAAEVPHNFPCCLPPVPPLPIQFSPVEPHRAYILRIRKHGWKNPVQITACPDPLPVTDRLPRKYISGISGKRFLGIFDHSCQNQFFFGSRQCHIQYAQFLSEIFSPDPVCNLRPEQTVFFTLGCPEISQIPRPKSGCTTSRSLASI